MDGWCLSSELSLSLMEFPHLETRACILKIPIDHLRAAQKLPFANASSRHLECPNLPVPGCILTSLLSHVHRCEHLECRHAGSSCCVRLTIWLALPVEFCWNSRAQKKKIHVIRMWFRAGCWKKIKHVFAVVDSHRCHRCGGWELSGVCMWLDPRASRCGAVKRREVNLQKASEEPRKAFRRFGGRSFRIRLFLCCRLMLIFTHILLIWGWICLEMQNVNMFRNRLL